MTTRASQDSIGVHIPELPGAAPGPATTALVQKAYVRDLPDWEAKGWRPRRDADGTIMLHHSLTGPQCWVERDRQPSLLGLGALSSMVDWID